MPGGSSKFRDDWMEESESNMDHNGDYLCAWAVRIGTYQVRCKWCYKVLDIENGGKCALKQHAKIQLHKKSDL